MNYICAKIKSKSPQKYRILTSSTQFVYPPFNPNGIATYPYTPGATLQENEWFYITQAKTQKYSINLLSESFTTADFESLSSSEFAKIDYLFVLDEHFIFFQRVAKSRLISHKGIIRFGERFEYRDNCEEVTINTMPDAIYDKSSDILYFQKLESLTKIFKGIDQLYREATQEEVEFFLRNDFIRLANGYSSNDIKTANRKRIALVSDKLSKLKVEEKKKIVSYIESYCPELNVEEGTFDIGSENELKQLLYGIDQRFYTTHIGEEKRMANSIITLTSDN